MENNKIKVCIISSAGGHLTQALLLAQDLEKKYNLYYVTYGLPHIRKLLRDKKAYYIIDPHLSFSKYLINFLQSFKIFLNELPDYVITTGSGISIPTCLIGKALRSRIIYIETCSRVTSPSRTGRILYPFADLFIVQWKPILKVFPKAKYCGSLL